jgi:hypothetical protein
MNREPLFIGGRMTWAGRGLRFAWSLSFGFSARAGAAASGASPSEPKIPDCRLFKG